MHWRFENKLSIRIQFATFIDCIQDNGIITVLQDSF